MPGTILGSENRQASSLVELTYSMRGSWKKIIQNQGIMRGCCFRDGGEEKPLRIDFDWPDTSWRGIRTKGDIKEYSCALLEDQREQSPGYLINSPQKRTGTESAIWRKRRCPSATMSSPCPWSSPPHHFPQGSLHHHHKDWGSSITGLPLC